jgi:RecB family endonuclease NucS
MAIWRMTDAGPVPLRYGSLDLERRLEDMIVLDPSLTGMDLLVVGRQVRTAFEGNIDVVAVDVDAHVHVLELKRGRTPREVVAQVLDYGSWAQTLTLDEISAVFAEQNHGTFRRSIRRSLRHTRSRPVQLEPAAHHRGFRARRGV